jgi:ectoine hydroxylase-related dioxygenase (phytanoyl-CoA dioxygenase family)
MGMDLEKQELVTQFQYDQFKDTGILILKDFFQAERVAKIRESAESVFARQFNRFGYKESFRKNIQDLFDNNFDDFVNCGKIIQQGLWDLYEISTDYKIKLTLNQIGISSPNMCTRPVLFFNNKNLAKEDVYYKTPPHQDWISMKSSDNSVVIWIPLVDVNKKNGSVIFYPGTHKLGPLNYERIGGFAKVNIPDEYKKTIQPELKVGDVVIFSTLLVHESGDIEDDSIRWSCHFRYTDLDSKDFIDRGFPNPYEYKPIYR